MFPVASPNSALFAQLASGGATPSTLDFHRTAMSAAAKRDQANGNHQQAQAQAQAQTQSQPQPQVATIQPQEMPIVPTAVKTESKPASGPFDPHDNDAANGLFMLAQGRNGAQATNQFAAGPGASAGQPHPAQVPQSANQPHAVARTNGGSVDASGRDVSEGSIRSDASDQTKPNARGKGKKNPPATNGRRKADEPPAKAPPSKKAKGNANHSMNDSMSMEPSDDEDDDDDDGLDENGKDKSKMTDEEKRKNFLERNR